MSFDQLGLSEPILRAIADAGYTSATPIQTQAIPPILDGRDVLAAAQTGTGKTAAFTLPLLERLSRLQPVAKGARPVRVLVLTPTRELAAQVEENIRTYGKHLPLRTLTIFGGVGINPQIAALARGVDILVATPGRLLDHLGQKTVSLANVETLILDEADRMLDMGFIHDIRRLMKHIPAKRQTLLISATFAPEILTLSETLLNNPVRVEVARRNTTNDAIDHIIHPVDAKRKTDLLIHLVREKNWSQVLVFSRTKHGANRIAEKLIKAGIESAALHGNKSQSARTKALAGFKDGSVQVLVATDIAARGLDIDQLPQVVNFDLPNVPSDYVHRIGRTGRAGATGQACSFVAVDEKGLLADIERLLKHKIRAEVIAGFEPGTAAPQEAGEETAPRHRPTTGAATAGRPAANSARRRAPRRRTPAVAGNQ